MARPDGDVSGAGRDPEPTALRRGAAVELLANQISGKAVAPDELLFEPELVVRASTAPAR